MSIQLLALLSLCSSTRNLSCLVGTHLSSWGKGRYDGFPSVSANWNVTLHWALHSALSHGRFRACCSVLEMGNWSGAAESWEQGASIASCFSLGKTSNPLWCTWVLLIPQDSCILTQPLTVRGALICSAVENRMDIMEVIFKVMIAMGGWK